MGRDPMTLIELTEALRALHAQLDRIEDGIQALRSWRGGSGDG
jgi:hypothetical protein